ncbi:RNA polymerase sigma factor [Sphingobacteriales bacterium UPWRP_1]|nr:RNA polymerase subunit sigma-70 [Sphingobacteriales bacterium TSM_CSS]PSJ72753.1 RNA polymerase sigma factor [Sphingobacteriales bacterium UPWRP_1]
MKQQQNYSDAELIQGCINCNRLYQERLYARFSAKMFAICLRYARDYHSAEDILQEGFIKVYQNIQKFRNEGSFEGWLRRIFVNTAIEHYRRSTPMYPILEVTQAESEMVREEVVENLAAADMMKMIQSLSPGYRTIFNLYVIEGYSHKEIADMLGISEGTSKSQLARARYLLQEKVKQLNQYSEQAYV